ncbi:hypothetical protein HYH03_008392 [Edaphochlamys debaryana]|uniref:Ribosomal protein L19 n=1 Tax=Edaphochlamys debaryana TaxID=47281 RepID=A0A836BZD2_9CHLO|nr:hypothetical protein HYH03_008392 [Edaphochlamys debaryana]|eukprot:KAG2493254.1 hypothetical protein HYH03_008392 [Edaphochlamys debaryana]
MLGAIIARASGAVGLASTPAALALVPLATATGASPQLIAACAAQAWRSHATSTSSADRGASPSPTGPTPPSGPAATPAAPSTSSAETTAAVSTSSGSQPGSTPRGLQQLKFRDDVLRDLRPPAQPYQLLANLTQRPTPTPALYTPWTPTRALQRRSKVANRMGFMVQVLEHEQMARVRAARPLPAIRAGDILEVRMMIPEAERKVVVYRGVCIATYIKGLRSSFKLYNVYPDTGGVVQHIPMYMPDLLGVKVVGRIPAKQERLFHLLDKESSDHTFQNAVATVK